MLHRREPWRRCAGVGVRNHKSGGIRAEVNHVLHLGEAWQRRKGESRVLEDGQVATDVGQRREVDASEHGIAINAEVRTDKSE